MNEFETRVLAALVRIADALESKSKPRKADLFAEGSPVSKSKQPERSLPAEFHLNGQLRDFAAKNGFAKQDFMFEQFKSHHRAKGSRFVDWEAAWRTWVLNQVKFNGGALQPRPTDGVTDGRI